MGNQLVDSLGWLKDDHLASHSVALLVVLSEPLKVECLVDCWGVSLAALWAASKANCLVLRWVALKAARKVEKTAAQSACCLVAQMADQLVVPKEYHSVDHSAWKTVAWLGLN